MRDSEELMIFKNCVWCIVLWLLCTVSALCICGHIIDDSYRVWDILPIVVLGGRSFSYFYGAIQYHKMLKSVQEINRGGDY